MGDKKPDQVPVFAKVLAAGCLGVLGTLTALESDFTMSIFSVIVLAIVSLFLEIRG